MLEYIDENRNFVLTPPPHLLRIDSSRTLRRKFSELSIDSSQELSE